MYFLVLHAFTDTNQNKTTYFKLGGTSNLSKYIDDRYDNAVRRECIEYESQAEAMAVKAKYMKSVQLYKSSLWGKHKFVFVVDAARPPKLADIRISNSDIEKYSVHYLALYKKDDKYAIRLQKSEPTLTWTKIWQRKLDLERAKDLRAYMSAELMRGIGKDPEVGIVYTALENVDDSDEVLKAWEDYLVSEPTGEDKDRDGISKEYGEEYEQFL